MHLPSLHDRRFKSQYYRNDHISYKDAVAFDELQWNETVNWKFVEL